MAVVEVKVPAVGESVTEAMIHRWHKATGDFVKLDDVLLELETDKATVEVTATADGQLETLRKEGDTIAIGDVIAKINTEAVAPKSETPAKAATPSSAAPQSSTPTPTAQAGSQMPLSPAVNRMVNEFSLPAAQIPASGKGGRITKGDVIDYMDKANTPAATTSVAVAKAPAAKESGVQLPSPKAATGAQRTERREPMSMLRRRIAERLVQAQSTAAILTTFNEVDMKAVMDLRKLYKEDFQKKHGIGLGFMSFFVKAAIEALKSFPAINGWIEGNEIVYHDYYDIGVAVSGDRGLVVPVVRDADRLSMAEVEQSIAYYGQRAREGKLGIDDMQGGTFTLSNGGVFGSLLSTPILNPPQSAILGMHKIQERPIAINGQVVIRPMMYLALSYDHRIVDGKEAVQFLVKIKDCIEDPTRLLLGV